ncbi:asparagine synthase-related protein [Sphingomonas paucimobilis]|uniref:asparagine synthase-related protein n=1 Tax=Sphingomonas paucimobilis TaxID=13689 RepID=UPI0016045F71|nr:asparagine synthase-related protein [Sphingomonas paucimobilis]
MATEIEIARGGACPTPRDHLNLHQKLHQLLGRYPWFRGALADDAARLAHSGLLRETGWFDLAELERLAADHRSGRAEHGRTLWQMLMLERSLKRLF